MYILDRLKQIFFSPIVHLPAGPITLGSITLALFIIFLARLFAAIAGRGLNRLLAHRGVDDSARFAMAKIARYCILLVGILVAFTSIGLKLDALFAASAALLVGIGFGLQTIAQNFISGIILLIERPVGKGDFVQIGQAHGSVVDIGLRATTVVTRDEVTIIVPNSELITGQVVNHSIPTTRRRIAIGVGVAYGSDLALVKRLLLDIAAHETGLLSEPVPEVRLEAFGASSLDFTLLVWIAEPSQDLRLASNVRFAIEAAFRTHAIEIPFPQQELRLRPASDPPASAPSSKRD
ncbi:MAG TPA: mechanosensitive ion channel domain-containing protein [Polyangia bacterium]|jgi:small-conductance mechanosensitive channel|nr:mechanosensitive ion channel domain-containing protein [Polyangia bacterium]HWE28087.1 mechanosensitive ion channel domain-containing protein [Polyangia bacterium]